MEDADGSYGICAIFTSPLPRRSNLTLAAEKKAAHIWQPSLSRPRSHDLEYECWGPVDEPQACMASRLTAAEGEAGFLDHARLALAYRSMPRWKRARRVGGNPNERRSLHRLQTESSKISWLAAQGHAGAARGAEEHPGHDIERLFAGTPPKALVRGRLDVAFLRTEPTFDLRYELVDHEPVIVLMPSDHRLTSREAIHPRELVGEIFIGRGEQSRRAQAVTEELSAPLQARH